MRAGAAIVLETVDDVLGEAGRATGGTFGHGSVALDLGLRRCGREERHEDDEHAGE